MTGPTASIIPWAICFSAGRHLCVALFELMQLHRELETNGMVDPAALMNAIWRDNPAYARRL